jgi:Protein of unknown function (DUF3303)
MKTILTWNVRPGAIKEAAGRFLAGQAVPEPGVKMLGRWHKTDMSGGVALYETDNPAALYAGAAKWADVLEFQSSVVIEDAEAGPVLAQLFGGKG